MMRRQIVDVDNNLKVCRYGNGIQLIKSEKMKNLNTCSNINSELSVSSLLKLPVDVYFYNSDGFFQLSNESSARSCGFNSANDSIGRTLFETSKKKLASNIINNNKRIINSKRMEIIEEEIILANEIHRQGVSVKMPWYYNNKIIGVFGCTIVLGSHPLAYSLSLISELGLLCPSLKTSSSLKNPLLNNSLSRRESECLRFFMFGKSAREIAEILGLSKRTVEFYIGNIKSKFNVYSKSSLIEKAFEYFNISV